MNIGDKVNIKLNDTLWKDKTGTIENIENNTVTVLVDFDDKGHKIRQLFNIEDLTESLIIKEELPVQDGDDLELVADDNAFFKITNGILRGLNVDREDLETVTSINIPNSVTTIGPNTFAYCKSLTIYCEAESKPKGWHKAWNSSNRPVVYGYKGKLTEDIEDVESDELELVELEADTSDERLMALAEYFKISPWEVTERNFGISLYEIAEESNCEAAGETYYVLTDAEADDMAADNFRNLVMDDPIYYMGGVENALDYIDVDHFQDMMEEDAEYRVDDMSDDELIEEGLDCYIITFPDDFELLSYVKADAVSEMLESHPEYSELSEDELLAKAGEEGIVDLEDRENYELRNERETLYRIRSELIAQYQSDYGDPIDWYIDMFGREDFDEYVTNNTDLIDVDRYVDDIIRYGYDSREYYIGDGSSEIDLGNGYYAFRYE